jgi:hypothetical protein
MLRSEREILVNEVLVALQAAQDHYRDVAGLLAVAEPAQLLEGLAGRRERFAERIRSDVQNLGYLPAEPDADRQAFAKLATRFKALITPDDRAFLLQEIRKFEDNILESLDNALTVDLPPEVKQHLRNIRDEIENDHSRL